MKISLNWLKDYVDLDGISAETIADKLTKTTCEIEGVEHKTLQEGIVAGEVIECKKHVSSDHLHVLKVKLSTGETRQIVCGAPNAREGIYVAVDTLLPSKELRGVKSDGMCCSLAELGLAGDDEGIWELENLEIPACEDWVFEIDNKSITNRPDLWGHYGLARELSVIFGRKLKGIDTGNTLKFDKLPRLDIKIESKNCLSYSSIMIDNVDGISSPFILQNRLYNCGHGSHGFLVDITNYVMLCFGNPVHAFDADKFNAVGGAKGKRDIKIRIGSAGRQFITLKDNIIEPDGDMLFVKSNDTPVALAGIMGGKDSGISKDTKSVIFEIASFDAINIRRTAMKLNLRTDASARYEKGIDPEVNFLAVAEVLRLVEKYAKRAVAVSSYTRVINYDKRDIEISLTKEYLDSFVGVKLSEDGILKTLCGLGFDSSIEKGKIGVKVPSFRSWNDIANKYDVIEEIVRFYGYENIKPLAPKVTLRRVERDIRQTGLESIKDCLVMKYGFTEVHTNIWYNTGICKSLNIEPVSYLKVINPFNKNDDKIRSDLLTSLLCLKQQGRIFEAARVWKTSNGKGENGEEEVRLSGVCESYIEAAEILRDLFDCKFKLRTADKDLLHPINNASVLINGQNVGCVGVIHPRIGKDLAGFEINLSMIDFKRKDEKAADISKFPKTILDFTFEWNGIYDELSGIFDGYDFYLKDIYENKFTLSFVLKSLVKTFTKSEIDAEHKKIIERAKRGGLSI
ncbi:MAG: phenylalanine--tRNA ligase subunit beta [Christensenellaceae bacterium]|jgi:phenylalanyl-tRNA synthetase beta chain|nr:phenylalanine--tRNA ligase subunit beta [Christensenellaceae bacterium]